MLQFKAAGKTVECNSKKRKKIIELESKPTEKIKDFSLTIFHALGKFLYNKRLVDGDEPKS
jgi:hypothetical protein